MYMCNFLQDFESFLLFSLCWTTCPVGQELWDWRAREIFFFSCSCRQLFCIYVLWINRWIGNCYVLYVHKVQIVYIELSSTEWKFVTKFHLWVWVWPKALSPISSVTRKCKSSETVWRKNSLFERITGCVWSSGSTKFCLRGLVTPFCLFYTRLNALDICPDIAQWFYLHTFRAAPFSALGLQRSYSR